MLTHRASCSNSPIVTLVVGPEQRIFAAHENVLAKSPFFSTVLRKQYMESSGKRLALPDEDPEVLSSILEYLYKGDYSPKLVHNKRRDVWEIESNDFATVQLHGIKGDVLKDTVIYCASEKYGLDELKRIALRKQGLRKLLSASFRVSPSPWVTHESSVTNVSWLHTHRYRHSVQHHPALGSLCLRQHFRQ